MTRTLWIDDHTGACLATEQLADLHQRARRLYEMNTHIFEDEQDALVALGAVPLMKWLFAGA